jgi:hypothetical protein
LTSPIKHAIITIVLNQYNTGDLELQAENEQEVWKDVVGYTGLYKVSNLGRVKRLSRTAVDCIGRPYKLHEMVLKPNKINGGYYQLKLTLNQIETSILLHRIVCEAFNGPALANKPFVNHKDTNKANNHKDNLEWCSFEENMAHAVLHGLRTRGVKNPHNILTEDQVFEVCRLYDSGGATKAEIARTYGVGHSTIRHLLSGKSWNWLTNRKQ